MKVDYSDYYGWCHVVANYVERSWRQKQANKELFIYTWVYYYYGTKTYIVFSERVPAPTRIFYAKILKLLKL